MDQTIIAGFSVDICQSVTRIPPTSLYLCDVRRHISSFFAVFGREERREVEIGGVLKVDAMACFHRVEGVERRSSY
jgi:hypothetical protein